MRILGPAGFGRYSFALGLAGLFALWVDFGFNSIVTREMSRRPSEGPDTFRLVSRGKLMLSAAAALGLGAFAVVFHWADGQALPLLLAFAFLLGVSWVDMGQAFTHAYGKFKQGAFLFAGHRLLVALAGLACLAAAPRVETLLLAVALASWAGAAATAAYFRGFWGSMARSAPALGLRGLFKESFPVFLLTVLIVVYFRIDTVMLSWLRGDWETGIYSAAYRFFEISAVLPGAVIAVLSADLSRRVAEGAWESLAKKYFVRLLGLGAAAMGVLWAISFFLPHLILGESYAASRMPLCVLSAGLLFLYPNFLLSTLIMLLGRPGANVWAATAAVFFNIGSNLYLIPRWGALGAAWSTLATEALLMGVSLTVLARARAGKAP